MKKFILIIVTIFSIIFSYSQKKIEGYVTDVKGDSIPYTSIYDSISSYGTYTDINGFFSIKVLDIPTKLYFSNVGYKKLEK